jgi:hypothetical protein
MQMRVSAMRRTVALDEANGDEGQWIVVVTGKVVASSEDARAMSEIAERYPREDTVVTRVLHPQASFY